MDTLVEVITLAVGAGWVLTLFCAAWVIPVGLFLAIRHLVRESRDDHT